MLGRVWKWLFGGEEAERNGRSNRAPEAPETPDPIDPSGVVEMPIEEAIDLHYFHPSDVTSVVDEYLWAAREKGFIEVRVIHGRGKGILRQRVQRQLAKHPVVVAFVSDGLGSTRVTLKPSKPRRSRSDD